MLNWTPILALAAGLTLSPALPAEQTPGAAPHPPGALGPGREARPGQETPPGALETASTKPARSRVLEAWGSRSGARFLWAQAGGQVGETRLSLRPVPATSPEAPPGVQLETTFSYDRQGVRKEAERTTQVDAQGGWIAYRERIDLSALRGFASHRECKIERKAPGRLEVRFSNNGKDEPPGSIETTPGSHIATSDSVEHWALLAADLPRDRETYQTLILYPELTRAYEVTFRKVGHETLAVAERRLEADRYSFTTPARDLKGDIWIDERGRLLQITFPGSKPELSLRVTLVDEGAATAPGVAAPEATAPATPPR